MRRLALVAAVLGLVFTMAAPASGIVSNYVHMEGPSFFDGTGAFVTTRGPLCPSGTTEDLENEAGNFSPYGFNLRVLKEFTCDDGSGTFQAVLRVRVDFARGVTFTWTMNRGTGDYEHIRGRGTGFVAFDIDGTGVYDVYRGSARVW